jgi:DNA-directed RNA polymerase subunit RPC12/RpoP
MSTCISNSYLKSAILCSQWKATQTVCAPTPMWKYMMLTIESLRAEFNTYTKGWSWEVEGILDKAGYVHPIDTDTKVISTVFERLSSPVLRSIAKKHGYTVETANQTTYPDFTMSKRLEGEVLHRIALDVKTTYLSRTMGFTLGGYNSFLRNGTKNILHPYSTYAEHWIIGFIYKQNPAFNEYDLEQLPARGEIQCPYCDVAVFIREKAAISGLRAGSGNTKNIGSVKLSSPQAFSTTNGPFMQFVKSKEACDHYWRHYEKYCLEISTPAKLVEHIDFAAFK